jgi:RHS repeat-associated protein
VVDANGGRSSTTYDPRGLVLSTQDQLGALTSFSQDPNGNTILRVDARNWPATYTIDALNRTVQTQYIDSIRVTNSFDAAGQQIVSADVTGITSYVWDLEGRKVNTVFPTGIALTNTLDPVGNRLVLADPFGRTSYSWDQQSRLLSIQNPLNERTTIQWDALDREQHRILGNGMAVSHTYDGAGRETLLQNISSAGAGLAIFTNSYSANDNRVNVAEIDGTLVSFAYDQSSQLVNEQRSGVNAYNLTYSWDPLGNRLQQISSGQITTSTFNSANELLTVLPLSGPATTNSWDANGNLLISNTGGALTTNTWSAENKLLNTAFSNGTTESYTYSQDGIRKTKTNASGVTVYTMDDLNVLLETTGTGVLQARNTNYPEIWGGLASQNRSSASSFYGFDSQSSTRILVSVGGVVLDNYSFSGFGVVQDSGSGTANPFLDGGQYGYQWDRTNWMSVGQRELDAVNGRWVSRDQMLGQPNYAYAVNNPVGYIDPSGEVVVVGVLPGSWLVGYSSTAKYKQDDNCCGIVDAFWDFYLDGKKPAPCSGWFVQEVYMKTVRTDCTSGVVTSSYVKPFWEAWPISAGKPLWQGDYGQYKSLGVVGYTDEFGQKDQHPETCDGQFNAHGDVKFFCNSDVLGDNPSTWGNGTCKSYAPNIPCKDSRPSFWATAPKSVARFQLPASHNVTVTWKCCLKTPPQWNKATADYPPTTRKMDPCQFE